MLVVYINTKQFSVKKQFSIGQHQKNKNMDNVHDSRECMVNFFFFLVVSLRKRQLCNLESIVWIAHTLNNKFRSIGGTLERNNAKILL